ncbi:GST-like protein [Rheinheimera nanhaiensis E407-8]|uniref:GST-like protein n=2 Tax=Rheinheimera TaxID=67575 RepID=I1DYP1_9GAMM|nr:GST-like protein [Rheinheimera nanhaiensis E407-8]
MRYAYLLWLSGKNATRISRLACIFALFYPYQRSSKAFATAISNVIGANMSSPYILPKVWTWDAANGGQFASINRPISGATHEKALPKGKQPLQLYSLATPNGVKVTIMLEELLELGKTNAEYDAWLISIKDGDQFGSGFVEINPNSKIPALLDTTTGSRVFESGSILLYLAEKFGAFLPTDPAKRTEALNWLFWQMGSAPFVGGGFGHFYAYAPEKYEYPINRYAMETKRQLDVLDKQLAKHAFVAGDEYSIADMAIWPWYGGLVLGRLYDAAEFLDVASYKHVLRWAKQLDQRPAVQRGYMVNRNWGDGPKLPERHSSADFNNVRG